MPCFLGAATSNGRHLRNSRRKYELSVFGCILLYYMASRKRYMACHGVSKYSVGYLIVALMIHYFCSMQMFHTTTQYALMLLNYLLWHWRKRNSTRIKGQVEAKLVVAHVPKVVMNLWWCTKGTILPLVGWVCSNCVLNTRSHTRSSYYSNSQVWGT